MIYFKLRSASKNNKAFIMSTENHLLNTPQILIKSIIICLNQLISQAAPPADEVSLFNLKTAPTISISDYLTRMVKYMNASPSVYVYSLVLLDRAQEFNPNFKIHKKNIHRLLLTSALVSAKYIDDLFYKNSFYANVGGVSLKVLNELELEFLHLINFNCHVETQTLNSYLERLDIFQEVNDREIAQKENLVAIQQKSSIFRESCVKEIKQELSTESSISLGKIVNDRKRQEERL